ncbi:hypothetical protein ACPPVO_34120 [Dactylosporangium sp. McL0621]|uniref:hypothetical protein n=1 Tax=Dactylosporangium sp. McL0621 TaxID=3415678 RepID=UPI003CE908BF
MIAGAAFACSRGGLASVLLGGYDGTGSWSLVTANVHDPDEQMLVETHEGLHHELQASTAFGLVASLSGQLAGRGVRRFALRETFREMVDRSQRVHEVFATTLAAGVVGVEPARRLLADNPEYGGHLAAGLRLAGPSAPEALRVTVAAAVLRCCMAPAAIATVIDRGFGGLRRVDLTADLAPDARLARFEAADPAPAWDRLLHEVGEAPAEDVLRACYEQARHTLDRAGLPSIAWAEQLEVAEALRAAVDEVDSELAGRLNIVAERRPVLDDGLEYDRQKVVLRERLPAQVTELTDPRQARESFGGAFACAVWMSRAVLAKQFRLPAQPALPDLVGALLTTSGHGGEPVVRLGLLPDGMTPGAVQAWLSPVPVVALTTHLTLFDQAVDARLRQARPVFVLMDLPIAWHVDDWIRQGATVRLALVPLDGPAGIELWLAAFTVDRRPGMRFLGVGGKVGMSVLVERLRQRHGERLLIDGEILRRDAAGVNAVLTRVFDTWHVLDQDAVE